MKDYIDYDNKRTTVIASNTTVNGMIKVIGDLEIVSEASGTIYCDQFIRVVGKCEGEIQAKDITIKPFGSLKGKIVADNTLINYSICQGDVKCPYIMSKGDMDGGTIECNVIEVFGKVDSEIICKDKVIVHQGGSVSGIIREAKSVVVEPGAAITNNVYCESIRVEPDGIMKGVVKLLLNNESISAVEGML